MSKFRALRVPLYRFGGADGLDSQLQYYPPQQGGPVQANIAPGEAPPLPGLALWGVASSGDAACSATVRTSINEQAKVIDPFYRVYMQSNLTITSAGNSVMDTPSANELKDVGYARRWAAAFAAPEGSPLLVGGVDLMLPRTAPLGFGSGRVTTAGWPLSSFAGTALPDVTLPIKAYAFADDGSGDSAVGLVQRTLDSLGFGEVPTEAVRFGTGRLQLTLLNLVTLPPTQAPQDACWLIWADAIFPSRTNRLQDCVTVPTGAALVIPGGWDRVGALWDETSADSLIPGETAFLTNAEIGLDTVTSPVGFAPAGALGVVIRSASSTTFDELTLPTITATFTTYFA